jgi:hypothetical protein
MKEGLATQEDTIDMSEQHLKKYSFFTEASFRLLMELFDSKEVKKSSVDGCANIESLDVIMTLLEKVILPLYK